MTSQKISEKFIAFIDDIENLSKDAWENLQKQTNFIFARLDEESKNKINLLMETGAFKSRAELISLLIKRGIEAESERFEGIEHYASQITDLELKIQNMTQGI
eukprot:Anaeramoba_ignava/a228810_21.p1 GENE.a228810_21~~a228810_21.p1  ORF type:complete len:103 (-),score=20.36 a228810_21:49-357(-)